MPLCRCKAVESHSLGIVLRNTYRNTPSLIVALSNHKLPKAARRRALSSQRKPSRCIFRNTTAVGVAAAECTLAVRSAQRRPSRSHRKRSLHVNSRVFRNDYDKKLHDGHFEKFHTTQ
jgi:hypothetical protein